ncbi:Hypothetical protein A7982_05986 [Minicystis rosea]|nr:Hypothetical protein A7982_05986 [Minicystis rosea]
MRGRILHRGASPRPIPPSAGPLVCIAATRAPRRCGAASSIAAPDPAEWRR